MSEITSSKDECLTFLPTVLLLISLVPLVFLLVTVGLAQHSISLAGLGFHNWQLVNTHACCMVCCFVLLVLAVLARVFFFKRTWVHATLATLGLVAGVCGAVCVFLYKLSRDQPHLFSVHELLGFASLVVALIHWSSTGVAFFLGCFSPRFSDVHVLLGSMTWIGVSISVCTGATYFITTLDLSQAPYDGFSFRTTFLYIGFNVLAILVVVVIVMTLSISQLKRLQRQYIMYQQIQ